MAELCHVCDLFRMALFGPTDNITEDHLDDGQGNDLPSPMADAPAKLAVRSRSRPSSTRNTKPIRNPDAAAHLTRSSGATAAPSVTSEVATPVSIVPGAAAVAATSKAEPSKGGAGVDITPGLEAPAVKSAPKTKFSKRPSRELKSPCMSFDDVELEEDDSDGELFLDDRPPSGSRSPGVGDSACGTKQSVQTSHREVDLTGSPAKAFADPKDDTSCSPPADTLYNSKKAHGAVKDTVVEIDGADVRRPSNSAGTVVSSDRYSAEPDLNMEAFPTSSGGDTTGLSDSVLIGDRSSIPSDGTLELTRPHGQSDSFHGYKGYKGYPGYEPDTPAADNLTVQHSETSESMVNSGEDVDGLRGRVKSNYMAAPSSYSVRYDPLESGLPSDYSYLYGEDLPSMPQAQGRYQQAAIPHHDKEVRDQNGQVQITSTRKQKRHYYEHHTPNQQHQRYQQQRHSQPSSRATDVAYRGHESPTDSAAGSMASTFRRDENSRDIQRVPSEDGMGSVLGTIAGSDYSHNQDLHWRRSALKKFNKVMVKGEGLRVIKHNRSGGSQQRIICYDPEVKALVWNSKSYRKKAGSANIPIVDIKRVGREGKTVSITAAGRGTIGFEPQRTRDAEILTEALLALVEKEKRSATWRG